jgi:putative flippase GtrA
VNARWPRLAGEIWRYLMVGMGATVVAVVLFNLLVHGFADLYDPPLNRHPSAAYVLANVVGMLISYRGTRGWAFRHRDTAHADGGRTAFVAINLATMLIPLACLWLSRNAFGLDDPLSDNLSANVVGLALANAARFVLTRQWVFNVKREEVGLVELTEELETT